MSIDAYVETEMSKRARSTFERYVHPESPEGKRYSSLYAPGKRRAFLADSGELDIQKVYRSLGVDDQEFALVKQCIALNLTDEEVSQVILHRSRELYGEWKADPTFGTRQYRRWCERFGISADESVVPPDTT